MEKKKRLSLAERISQQNTVHTTEEERLNEQKIISFISSPTLTDNQESTHPAPKEISGQFDSKKNFIESDIDQVSSIRSRSGQDQVSNIKSGSGQDQDQLDPVSILTQLNIDTGSRKDQNKNRSISGQGQVSNIESISGQGQIPSIRSGSGQLDTDLYFQANKPNEILLAPQQQKTYSWFLNNGVSGFFNKFQIQRDTGINHPTIRKSILKLQMFGLITLSEYDPASRQQRYMLNLKTKVNMLPISNQGQVSGIRSISNQGQVSGIGLRSGQGQLDTKIDSYNIDRQILNNLSIYVEHSEFWKGQGLTLKKCEQLINEIQHCTPDFLLVQLQFGEYTEKLVKSDKPISYFRSCLMSGGLERPKGFEFPEEKATRIKQLEFEAQQKALSEQEIFRQKEKELADKKVFFDLLKDKETVEYLITQIESKFITPTTKFSIKSYRTNGEIDSKLEIALQREFFMSDSK